MSISKAVLMGKVIRDPEKRFTQSNVPVTTFSINVMTSRSEGINLVRVITWRNLADKAAESIKKGTTVVVDGNLQTSTYTDSSGIEKKGLELNAVNFEVLSSYKEEDKLPSEDIVDDVPPPSADDYNITQDELIDEEEIPF